MEDLTRKSAGCGNMTGYAGLWIANDYEVEDVEEREPGCRKVVFKSSGGWGRVDAKNIYMSDTPADGARQLEVTCQFRCTPDQVDYYLDALSMHRFLLKLKDRNGNLWLAGDKEQPLHFEYSHVGETGGGGVHEYQLRFFRQTNLPLYKLFP